MTKLSREGYRTAQVGGILIAVGGLVDLSIRTLLPAHLDALGLPPGEVPLPVERLVLALLHALGAALVGVGVAVVVLLRQARAGGGRLPLFTAGAVASLAEGVNAAGILGTGSPLFLAPLGFAALVVVGILLVVAGDRG